MYIYMYVCVYIYIYIYIYVPEILTPINVKKYLYYIIVYIWCILTQFVYY